MASLDVTSLFDQCYRLIGQRLTLGLWVRAWFQVTCPTDWWSLSTIIRELRDPSLYAECTIYVWRLQFYRQVDDNQSRMRIPIFECPVVGGLYSWLTVCCTHRYSNSSDNRKLQTIHPVCGLTYSSFRLRYRPDARLRVDHEIHIHWCAGFQYFCRSNC